MKIKTCFLLSVFTLNLFYSQESIKEPENPSSPVIDENIVVEIPSVENPFKNGITNNSLYIFRTELTFGNGEKKKLDLHFTNLITLSVTNYVSNRFSINTFSIFDLSRVEIKKWKVENVSNNLYIFIPQIYKLYFNDGKESKEYNGNIPCFNVLTSKVNGKDINFYTIFYDYWIKGKNNIFRWKNSKSLVFEYNLVNPLFDVVCTIVFLW